MYTVQSLPKKWWKPANMARAHTVVYVKAVSALITAITGWVAESILDEPDLWKRILW